MPSDQYTLPDPGLTDEERAALWLAAQAVRLGGQAAGPDALFKLGGAPFSGGGEPLAADLGADSLPLAEAFSAVSERRILQFDYRDRARVVAPYGLVHRRGHWYVVGADRHDDSTIKAFRVDRAAKMLVTGPSNQFARPSGFRAGDFIPTVAWEAGGEDVEAEVTFDADVAWWARRQLTGRSKVTERADGSLAATMPVANPEAFIGWMLSFDSGAEILSPADLRRRLVHRVEAAG